MSSIRYRKDGRFELRFYHNGQQYSVYSKERSKLRIKKDEKIKNLKKQQKEKLRKKEESGQTLKIWFEFWYQQYKQPFVSEQTASEIKSLFKNHILPKFGRSQISNITVSELQPFFNKIPKSRKKELVFTYFNACLQKAEDLEYIKKNPIKLIVRDKKIKSIRTSFSIEEQEAILKHIKQNNFEFYKLILFYLATGVRRTEALSLTSDDFDGQIVHIRGTKTDNADRFIKITQELKDLVFKQGPIFNYLSDYVTKKFKEYLSDLKISGTLHCLRHSYATNQYYLGTPPKQVQMQMGHYDISVTMNIYTNIKICEDKNKISDKIKALYNDYYIELKN